MRNSLVIGMESAAYPKLWRLSMTSIGLLTPSRFVFFKMGLSSWKTSRKRLLRYSKNRVTIPNKFLRKKRRR